MSSSYKPPASRMRKIIARRRPPLPRMPASVEEALAQARAAQDRGETVEEVVVEAEGKEFRVTAGADATFGTADDDVVITDIEPEAEPPPVPEAVVEAEVEPEPEVEDDTPVYSVDDTKSDLKALCKAHNVVYKPKDNKAALVAVLDAHFA